MDDISFNQLLLANVIVAAGSCFQSVIGLGIGLLCAPLLFLIDAQFVPAPLVMLSMVLTVLLVLREKSALQPSEVKWLGFGGCIGTILAGLTLIVMTASQFELMFGIIILLSVFISMMGTKYQINKKSCSIAGIASGYMGTLSAIGGPPVALLYQHSEIRHIRANLSAFFALLTISALTVLFFAGRLGINEIQLFVFCVPGVIVGFWASKLLAGKLSPALVRPCILTITAISALIAIGRSFN